MQSKVQSHNGSSTSIDSILVFTLDPKDKYLPPGVRRAATTSAIQQRRANLAATAKIPHRAARSEPEGRNTATRTGQSTLERPHSLLTVFNKLRQTRSAGSNAKSGPAWPRKLFSRSGSRAAHSGPPEDIPEVPKLPSPFHSRAVTASSDGFDLPIQRLGTPPPMPSRAPPVPIVDGIWGQSRPDLLVDPSHDGYEDLEEGSECVGKDASSLAPNIDLLESISMSCAAPLEKLRGLRTRFADPSNLVVSGEERQDRSRRVEDVQIAAKDAVLEQCTSATNATSSLGATKYPTMSEQLCPTNHGYTESTTSSYAASDDLSPYLDSNTTHSNPMSPLHLSQPGTPVMSEFGDEHFSIRRNSTSLAQLTLSDSQALDQSSLRPPSRVAPAPPARKPATAYSTLGGFQGYSLPDSVHTSVLTIHQLPSNPFKPIPADTASIFGQQGKRKDLVESWNDGSEHHMSALSELVEDLGYLGKMII